jgi:hypothetical protein
LQAAADTLGHQVVALHVERLAAVQQQLGHASIGQTGDTYGHVQPDRHEAAAARLDRYLVGSGDSNAGVTIRNPGATVRPVES